MSKKETSNSENLKNALCYAPFVWIVLFFVESDKSDDLKKHIKYGTFIFLAYILLNMITFWYFGWFLFVIYLWGIWFLGWKVYNWEKVDLEYIDKFEETVIDKVKEADSKTDKK